MIALYKNYKNDEKYLDTVCVLLVETLNNPKPSRNSIDIIEIIVICSYFYFKKYHKCLDELIIKFFNNIESAQEKMTFELFLNVKKNIEGEIIEILKEYKDNEFKLEIIKHVEQNFNNKKLK